MKYLLPVFLLSATAWAGEWSYENRRSLSADAMNYFGPTQDNSIKVREPYVISLGRLNSKISLIGDCGNLDVCLSFKSIYAEANRLFRDLKEAAIGSAESIGRAAPMLGLCYFSPTACSIAKNLQLYASYSAKLKFDQCQAINRYTSTQASAYKEQQADCLRKKMASNNNITEAVESCKSSADRLASWLDGNSDTKISANQLVQSSARWAGLKEEDGNLIAALIGGVEYEARGRTRVNFGSYSPLTPVRIFEAYTKAAYRRLCGEDGLLRKWRGGRNPRLDAEDYFQSKGKPLPSHELMNALGRLPEGERNAACDRLASAMSLTKFINEMEERFDQLYMMSQNPHLPDSARERLEDKTKRLIDHTMAVLKIKDLKQDSLNSVRSRILSEAGKASQHDGSRATDLSAPQRARDPFSDCDDFTICGK